MKQTIREIVSILLCTFILIAPMPHSIAEVEAQILTISGFYEDEISRRFIEQNPNVQIEFNDQKFTNEDSIKLAMLSGDTTYDIYTINSDWGLSAIAEKGYFHDLSGSQIISETFDGWYPQIRDVLSIEGKIVGYPVNLVMEVWGVNRTLEADYPIITYPQNYLIYLQSIAQNQIIREDYGINYVIDAPSKYSLMSDLIRTVLLEYENNGTFSGFDNDEFITCAETIRQMPEPEQIDEYVYDSLYQLPTYLTTHADLLDQTSELTLIPHAPLSELSTPVETLLTVMIVNPRSKSADLATKYLEFRANNEDIRVKYLMSPTLNEPVESENFKNTQLKYQEQMDELVRQRETAKPELVAQLENEIDSLKGEMEREDSRWLISPNSIQSYRDIAPAMLIMGNSAILGFESSRYFEQLMGIAEEFLESQTSGEHFAIKLNNKVKLMNSEQ